MRKPRVHSLETRRKMSETRKRIGSGKWNRGKKHTEEWKRRKAEGMRGNPRAWKVGHGLGEQNVNWKGGTTPLGSKIRANLKYRQWRSDIYERDGYTCLVCGKIGGSLHAHHIKSFALIIKENRVKNVQEALECEELWNLNNGQTLCKECHKKTDNYLSPRKH